MWRWWNAALLEQKMQSNYACERCLKVLVRSRRSSEVPLSFFAPPPGQKGDYVPSSLYWALSSFVSNEGWLFVRLKRPLHGTTCL